MFRTTKAVATLVAGLSMALMMAAPAQAIYPTARTVTFPFPIQQVIAGRDGTFWGARIWWITTGQPGSEIFYDERLQLTNYRVGGAAPKVVLDISVRPSTFTDQARNSVEFLILGGTDAAGNLALLYKNNGTLSEHYLRIAPDGTVLTPDTILSGLAQIHTVRANGVWLASGVGTGLLGYSPSGSYLGARAFNAGFAKYVEFEDGTYAVVDIHGVYALYDQGGNQLTPRSTLNGGHLPYITATNQRNQGVFVLAYARSYLRINSSGQIGTYRSYSSLTPALDYIWSVALTNENHVVVAAYPFYTDDQIIAEYDENDQLVGSAVPTVDFLTAVTPRGDVLDVDGATGHLYAAPRCGDAIVDADLGEQCDDGNAVDLDGCSSSCVLQACGNSTVESGEGCDDGNVVAGDGCDENCRTEDHVSEVAAPGAPVGTDAENDGASPADPLEVSLTSPSGGAVSLTEGAYSGGGTYGVLGQQVVITAPDETAEHPLVIALRIDASSIPPGTNPSAVQIFRNDVVVANCNDASGQANPDPCVASRVLQGDGDLVVTALSSHASTWYLGTICGDGQLCLGPDCTSGPGHRPEVCDAGAGNSDTSPDTCRTDCSLPHCGDHVVDSGEACDDGNTTSGDGCGADCRVERTQTKGQAACIAAAGKKGVAGINAGMKLLASCVAAAAKTGSDPVACFDTDASGKLKSATGKFTKAVTSACSQAPDFGYAGAKGNDAILNNHLLTDLFGDSAASAIIVDSKCQSTVTKVLTTIVKTALGQFNGCLKDNLGTMDSSIDMAACVAGHDDAELSDLVAKVTAARQKKCSAVSLSNAFPGECGTKTGVAFDECVTGAGICQACTSIEHIHGIDINCDQLDDGAINSSCPS